jgi:hypothetical protein
VHDEAALAQLRGAALAHEEADVRTGLREAATEVAADRTSTKHENLHGLSGGWDALQI